MLFCRAGLLPKDAIGPPINFYARFTIPANQIYLHIRTPPREAETTCRRLFSSTHSSQLRCIRAERAEGEDNNRVSGQPVKLGYTNALRTHPV